MPGQQLAWLGGPKDGDVWAVDAREEREIEELLELGPADFEHQHHPEGRYRLERDGHGGYRWRWILRAPFPVTGRDEGPEA